MADFELADDFLPVYDVSDAVATVADADRQTAWRALLDVDLLKLGREAAGEAAGVDAPARSALDPDVRGRLDPARRTPG